MRTMASSLGRELERREQLDRSVLLARFAAGVASPAWATGAAQPGEAPSASAAATPSASRRNPLNNDARDGRRTM